MDVSPELAELSRTIDMAVLGRRIKAARVAAGLTQSELAAPEASATYVSRIEHGDRRPDLKLLVRFAAKADVTVEQLLVGLDPDQQAELRVRLDCAASSIALGDGRAALEDLAAFTTEQDGQPPNDVTARAALLEGLAHRVLGRLDEAIMTLEELTEGGPRESQWLEATVALTRCYVEAGEPVRAVESGEAALDVLAANDALHSSHAVDLATALAEAYDARGDRARAIDVCARVAPHLTGDAPARTAAYRSSARLALAAGHVHLAGSLAEAARVTIGSQAQSQHSRLHSGLAQLLLSGSQPDVAGARSALDAATAALTPSSSSAALALASESARIGLARARAHLLEDDGQAAIEALAFDLDADAEPLLAAQRFLLLGKAQRRTRRAKAARESLSCAMRALEGAGKVRAAAQVWFDLGALLDELGDSEAAGDAYRHAAAATGLADSAPVRRKVRA